MLSKKEILTYIEKINERLAQKELNGEICLFGGAAMCLLFNTRPATKDIDAVFVPTDEFYHIIRNLAEEHSLPEDWLNSGVKGFVSSNNDVQLFTKFSNLTIYTPSPSYLFAMKCLAARGDTQDAQDIRFLLQHLNIKSVDQAFEMLEQYYPNNQVLPRTQYLLKELLENRA